MTLKNQEIDLEVNPYVNGRGTDQEVSIIRCSATCRGIEASIGFYCESMSREGRAETSDEALRRCHGIDNDRSFCR